MVANLTKTMLSLRCIAGHQLNNNIGNHKKLCTSIMLSNMILPKELKFETINKNLQLITPHGTKRDEHQPLVLLFTWIMAKNKHVKKYSDFYTNRGFQVLTVKATPLQLLWPTKGSQATVENVLNYLTNEAKNRPIIIHAFSVGAYMIGETMLKMETKQKYKAIVSRIVGHIYDSAVDYQQAASGVANSINAPKLIKKLLELYISFHLRLFHGIATRHYILASEKFYDTIIGAPSLFLFSKSDSLGSATAILEVIKRWDAKGIQVHSRCWDNSPHCNHMTYHQQEYIEALENFLKTINFKTMLIEEIINDPKLYMKHRM